MKSRLFVFMSILMVAALVVPSCSLPVLRFGNGASVTLALNGLVIPMARSDSSGTSSRLILPITARIKVDVTGPDNFQKSAEVMMGPNAVSLTINELPTEKELSFTIAALDGTGTALTKETVTAVLKAGQNSLTATLKPDPATEIHRMASNITSNVWFPIESTLTLAPGEYKLYKVDYMADTDTERQIQFDSQTFQWAWVRVYDENWNPIPIIAADELLGWVVVKLPAGSHKFMVAVANILPSGILPPEQVSGQLVLRQCVFIDKNGTGTGTSQDPAMFDPSIFNSYAGKSIFLRSGSYPMNTALNISVSDNFFIYGGLGVDWKSRPGPTDLVLTATATETSAVSIGESSSPNVFLDSIGVGVQEYGSVFIRNGLTIKNNSTVRIFRSNIAGCMMQTPISAGSPLASTGLSVEGGIIEIAASSIRGGFAGNNYASMSTSTNGIAVSGTAMYSLTVQSSAIDGGTAVTNSGAATTCGINLGSSASSGLVLINRTRLFGGISQSTSGTVSSFGINALSSSGQKLLIFNSMLSGGQALGSTTGASTYGIYTKDNVALCISGNVIDTGRALGTSGLIKVTGIYVDGTQNTNTAVICNAFLSTGDSTITYNATSAALAEANINFTGSTLSSVKSNILVTNDANGFFNVLGYTFVGTDNSGTYSLQKYVLMAGQSYMNVLEKFALPGDPMLFLRFNEWINGNFWRIGSSYATWLANSTINAIPSFVPTMLSVKVLASLNRDLGGNPRPASGIWKIGAFE